LLLPFACRARPLARQIQFGAQTTPLLV